MEPQENQNKPQENQNIPPENPNKSQENQNKPFSSWDALEKIETILSICGNIAAISGVTLIAAVNMAKNSPKIPDVQSIKSQLSTVQLGAYNPAETAKLQEQLAATFKNTQQCYSLLKQKLNQDKQKPCVDEVTLTLNQEDQSAHFIERLDGEIRDLGEMERRFQASQEAKVFLDKDDKLEALAKEAGDFSLVEYPVDSYEDIQDFYGNINDFLFTIYHCLVMGKPDLLDEVLDEEIITLALQTPAAYVKAFQFIRDQRVPNAMSDEAAIEINLYFDYLIDRLSGIA